MKTTTSIPASRSLKTFVLFVTLLLSFSPGLFAIDLQSALSRGLAGEVDNGYLAIPPGATNEAQPLVKSVNNQRRAAYASLATKNGVTPEIAGQVTFEKRYPEFPVGTWVKIQGRWTQK
ncbi:YdbL family protein [Prosthecochloris sp.]|uniref:YdbL family protein n=1 Tax=Prosthecochloris sp. TaxID=290513 RepID=UPI0025D8A37E|nr:YdbL family protein [Prosthecochloris sp.]